MLIAIGIRLASARPGYGLSLQGAGAGILYLTTFAAFRLYHVLPPVPGLLLLALVAASTVALAIRADSQPLAGLAVAGGFLAPMLTSVIGEPALLFGYFAILNAAIFALAWVRSWRALNLLGFVFTFVLGSIWAYRYYRPLYFATVEPFLVLFVVFYVAIAILYAHRGRFEARAPVDGLLVFGVPLVGFGLQAALVRDVEYGAAWSALALAIVYGLLFLLLRARAEAGLALLARAFLALAAIFATIAVPLAFDYRITAALWSVAAAAAFWLGVRQSTPLLRGFALLVEFGAGGVFLWSGAARGDDLLFANAFFVGAMLIALSGIVTAAVADRAGDTLPAPERGFVPLLLLWGVAWWLAGGAFELKRHLGRIDTPHATLAWVTAQHRSSAAGLKGSSLAAPLAGRHRAAAGNGAGGLERLADRAHDAGEFRRSDMAACLDRAMERVVRGRCAAANRRAVGVGSDSHAGPVVRRARGIGDRADRADRLGSERVGRPHHSAGDGLAGLRRGVAADRLPVPGLCLWRAHSAGR